MGPMHVISSAGSLRAGCPGREQFELDHAAQRAVMPRVVYERRRGAAGDALDLPDEEQVVAGLVLRVAAAFEDGDAAREQGRAALPVCPLAFFELCIQGAREAAREVDLVLG